MKKLLLLLFLFTTSLLLNEGFAPEILIKTPNGYTPIEQIEAGQAIQSYDSKNNITTSHQVIAKHRYTAKNYLVIKLENEKIICSLNQKFYLHALNKWIKSKELLNNETIRNFFFDEFSALDITKVDEPKELHTLTINPHHNFYVTQSDILAHNFAITIVWVIGEGLALGETAAILGSSIAGAGLGALIYGKRKHISKPSIEEFLEKALKPDNSKTPGRPTEKDGYTPPKNWDGKKVRHPKNGKIGWPDKKGNIWVPTGENGHGGPHWDVQDPKDRKKYDNVYPGGKIRPGK